MQLCIVTFYKSHSAIVISEQESIAVEYREYTLPPDCTLSTEFYLITCYVVWQSAFWNLFQGMLN